MKRLCLLLCGVIFFHTMTTAQDFEVERAHVDIHLNSKGYFDVVEKYDINFFSYRHGIIRDIQLLYDLENADGKIEKRRIKISKIKVPGHKSKSSSSFLQRYNEFEEIRIGNPNKTVTGHQHYEIRYRVHNAFLFDEEQVQFYWNIKTGNWVATFHEIHFNIIPPKGTELSLDDFFVYSGRTGSTDRSDKFKINYSNGIYSAQNVVGFRSNAGENVTVLLKMPKDTIKESKPLWPFWNQYGWTLILVGFIYVFHNQWRKHGKNKKVVSTISYFSPDGIDPPMAGFLIDSRADSSDLMSLIPHWGAQGIIRMEEIPKKGWFSKSDTKLINLKPIPEDSPHYEKEIYAGLFGRGAFVGNQEILISSLKDKFYTNMSSAKTKLKSAAQIYYDPKARKAKVFLAVAVVLVGIFLMALSLVFWGILATIITGFVVFILFVISLTIAKRNDKGNELLSDLKGFKQFIKVAEENKLRMLLKDDPHYFESTLGYALAFGMLDEWAKKFSNLDLSPPSWYTSPMGMVSMNHFSQSFASTMRSAQTVMVSAPSSSGTSGSSGGGSSGGGFGGGGGRSW